MLHLLPAANTRELRELHLSSLFFLINLPSSFWGNRVDRLAGRWRTSSDHCVFSLQVLCVWDVSDQLCVQRLTGIFPPAPEDTPTLLFLDEEPRLHRRLLLSFNCRLLLLESLEEVWTKKNEPV